jgi:hypothetical protein
LIDEQKIRAWPAICTQYRGRNLSDLPDHH